MLVKCLKDSKAIKRSRIIVPVSSILINLLTSICPDLRTDGLGKKWINKIVKRPKSLSSLKLNFTLNKNLALELQTKLAMPTGLE